MELTLVRNDSTALELRQNNYALACLIIVCCAVLALLRVVTWAAQPPAPLTAGDFTAEVLIVVFCALGLLFLYVHPHKETLTLEHGPRKLRIRRKRLFAESREDLDFDQVRAVKVEPGFCLMLETGDRRLRFPAMSVAYPTDGAEYKRKAYQYAAQIRAALGLCEGTPAESEHDAEDLQMVEAGA